MRGMATAREDLAAEVSEPELRQVLHWWFGQKWSEDREALSTPEYVKVQHGSVNKTH